jgi:phage portal protein BeeE
MFILDRQAKSDVRESMRTLLRYYKNSYLDIEECMSRFRGMTMVLAHMGAFQEMQLGHRVNSFLLSRKFKKEKR